MFDTEGFLAQQFKERIAEVSVPALHSFFGTDPPVWKVRNLTLAEMAQIRVARIAAKNQLAAIRSLGENSPNFSERVKTFESVLKLSENVESEVTARIEMVVIASVEPKVNYSIVAKLARTHAQVLWTLSDKISELTDGGAEVERLTPSGTMNKSDSPAC